MTTDGYLETSEQEPACTKRCLCGMPAPMVLALGIAAWSFGADKLLAEAAGRANANVPVTSPAKQDRPKKPPPLSHDPDPDPIQGLTAFLERAGHKPYDLFRLDGQLRSRRLIYHDRQFGTPVWMLDDSPTVDHCQTASVWSAWNADASRLTVFGPRPAGNRVRAGWFFNADYSRLTPCPENDWPLWDPQDPDIQFVHRPGRLTEANVRTGQSRLIAEWEPFPSERIYGLTRDQRHAFVDMPNRGIFVPFKRDENHPIPQLPLYDGRPTGPGGQSIGFNHFPVIYNHKEFGDLIALRTGMLVDRRSGEKTCIAAPLCGNTNYLRAFHEGRVRYPEGDAWNTYGLPWSAKRVRLPTAPSMDELYDLWLSLPHATHGHECASPDRRYIATDGGATRIFRVRDGETRSFRLSSNGGHYHLHWRHHPRFFVGWVRGWAFGSFLRPENANIEFQVFADGTFQPIVDTKHRLNGYYSGGDFSMLSPDATKIHYGSSMTGRFRNYIAVMARPRPPLDPSWRVEGDGIVLSWQPSKYHREIRGYVVYRSRTSGDGYEIVTPEPVQDTSWRDRTIEPGRAYYYVVSSIEHSGLESGYSSEVPRAGIGLPAAGDDRLTLYAEAEEALKDVGTDARPGLAMGVERRTASDWYYIYRHPESDRGETDLTLRVPADGRYHVWARVRSCRPERSRWRIGIAAETFEIETRQTDWTWLRVGRGAVMLRSGPARVSLATGDAAAQLDLLCLTTDPDLTPRGPRPENLPAPPVVTGLRASNLRLRVNQLIWDRPPTPGLSHYNVYASREPIVKPTQEMRIGSPTDEAFIDWGLKAGSCYHYAVTAVNRRGVESKPALAQAATPPAGTAPVEIVLAFAEAELTGSFERATAAGTRAASYVVPGNPAANRVTWQIDVPHGGDYYFWLRYLHRGSGDRGGEVVQEIRARLNGQPLTTLGGGQTDLNVPDRLIAPGQPLAPTLWTWAWPGRENLHEAVLPAGRHTLTLENLAPSVRYDVLLITDEPSFVPSDGRLRQR